MSRLLSSGTIGFAAMAGLAAIAFSGDQLPSSTIEAGSGPRLARFGSARAFQRFLDSLPRRGDVMFDVAAPAPSTEASLPGIDAAPMAMESEPNAQAGNPEITNNQTVGVDEGGIVKQIGRFLVVLQDGRLFTADLGEAEGAALRLADRIDVYRNPATAADWYDEMLVLGDRILVTAYNYREQASEITVVRIDGGGRLRREGRYLLSSNDYYSTENYATRLVGENLVFYTPLALDSRGPGGSFQWPRLRRADGDGEADRGDALIGPTDVYQPVGRVEWPVLHTISVCPLRQGMDCRTTAFVGPAMREFYVSPTDAFLWIGAPDGLPWSIDYANQRRRQCPTGEVWSTEMEQQQAMLYRVPLDGGPIGAVAADGLPTDQFAFDSRDGRFRALLARTAPGCVKAESPAALALLDLPLSDFASTVRRVSERAYTPLPSVQTGELENRFLGSWLVYGGRSGWSGVPDERGPAPAAATLFAVPLATPARPVRLRLPHNALRIERAGTDAVVTGYRDSGGLSLSYVSLGGQPRIASTTVLPRRFESEGRSHAFNAWVRGDGTGLIGLPTTLRVRRADRGWSDSESSDLSFIAIGPGKSLSSAGELALGRREAPAGYLCEVSCIDWYGNSRPIFTGGRIFALMGTDLVEGRMVGGRVAELARLDLTGPDPAARAQARR